MSWLVEALRGPGWDRLSMTVNPRIVLVSSRASTSSFSDPTEASFSCPLPLLREDLRLGPLNDIGRRIFGNVTMIVGESNEFVTGHDVGQLRGP